MERDDALFQSFVIRLYRADSQGSWRISLFHAQTGSRKHFLNLEHLYHWLDESTRTTFSQGDESPSLAQPESIAPVEPKESK